MPLNEVTYAPQVPEAVRRDPAPDLPRIVSPAVAAWARSD